MNPINKYLIASAIGSMTLATATSVHAKSFEHIMPNGSVEVDFRYRVESVDKDNALDTALANTLKSRITLNTGIMSGFSALLEGDNVLHVTDDFWDKAGDNTNNDNVVLDQETTQLNQAYFKYTGFNSVIKAGNQRINLDNQRHIGGVAFRQDEATLDAVSITNQSMAHTTIFAAFANNLNNIKNENIELDLSIINVKYDVNPELLAIGFFYGIETPDGETLNTLGIRTTGKIASLSFEAEVASQKESSENTRVHYYNFSVTQHFPWVTTKLGYEVLGSDDGKASFTTPLGTNHKFMGWSDSYLQAPTQDGIQDLNLTAITRVNGVKLVAQLHKFDAVTGNANLGSELGMLAAKQFGDYGASLKVAKFNGGDLGVDATKIWLTGTAKL